MHGSSMPHPWLADSGAGASQTAAPARTVYVHAQLKEGTRQLYAGCVSVCNCSSMCEKQHWKHEGHRQACKAMHVAAGSSCIAV